MLNCPRCNRKLKPAQIKRLWASYCGTQVKNRPVIWPNHSLTAGSRCRCQACSDARAVRRAKEPKAKPRVIPPDELTWDNLRRYDPGEWKDLISRRAADLRNMAGVKSGRKRRPLALDSAKPNAALSRSRDTRARHKLAIKKKRAESEGVWGRIMADAKARVESELAMEVEVSHVDSDGSQGRADPTDPSP